MAASFAYKRSCYIKAMLKIWFRNFLLATVLNTWELKTALVLVNGVATGEARRGGCLIFWLTSVVRFARSRWEMTRLTSNTPMNHLPHLSVHKRIWISGHAKRSKWIDRRRLLIKDIQKLRRWNWMNCKGYGQTGSHIPDES